MHLLDYSFGSSKTESEMQEALTEHLQGLKWYNSSFDYINGTGNPLVITREFHVPEIKRRSDIVVMQTKRKIFNIECKLYNPHSVWKQAQDHLLWADYSYICISAQVPLPQWFIGRCHSEGVGLIFWHEKKNAFVEGINGFKSTKINKDIRKKAVQRLEKLIPQPELNFSKSETKLKNELDYPEF